MLLVRPLLELRETGPPPIGIKWAWAPIRKVDECVQAHRDAPFYSPPMVAVLAVRLTNSNCFTNELQSDTIRIVNPIYIELRQPWAMGTRWSFGFSMCAGSTKPLLAMLIPTFLLITRCRC